VIIALVPAAGAARRMGHPKLLLPWHGSTVLGALVAALRSGGADRVLVIAAATDQPLLDWLASAAIECTVNPAPERGMLSTILAGLEALGGAAEAARAFTALLVCPGDLPALRPATVAATCQALTTGGASLAVPVVGNRHGHPLAIAPRLVIEIPQLPPGEGLRALKERFASGLVTVPVGDPGCVADLNTPAEYARLAAATPFHAD
jgi:molybdenum cofactor cytidylyltransferase